MKLDKNVEPFRATIESLNRLLEKHRYQGVIIGGVAVSLLGKAQDETVSNFTYHKFFADRLRSANNRRIRAASASDGCFNAAIH